jgi:hypothetical protein
VIPPGSLLLQTGGPLHLAQTRPELGHLAADR